MRHPCWSFNSVEKLGCQARSSRIFPLPRVALLCVKTREILNDQGRSLWCSILAFGERTLRKDEKNGWEFDFVLRFHVSLGIRIYCSCLIVYYNSQYLFLPPEWILTSNKYAIFQLLRSLKKKTVLSTYEFDCKLILPPNSLDTMMDITNKITQVDKLLQLWCNSQALIISEGIGLFLG